jgi:hypothetical protein
MCVGFQSAELSIMGSQSIYLAKSIEITFRPCSSTTQYATLSVDYALANLGPKIASIASASPIGCGKEPPVEDGMEAVRPTCHREKVGNSQPYASSCFWLIPG